ncbi:MAG: SPOR domain-containing protein [Bacteroidota bacterium]|nr:SPOR domain-containing protein [Bacteroidota bacterium]
MINRILILITFIATQYTIAQVTKKNSTSDPELIKLLPVFTSTSSVLIPIDKKIPESLVFAKTSYIIDSIASMNKKLKFMQGYRILVYSGTDKEEANLVKEKIYKKLPMADIYSSYKQPTYRIKLGDYHEKLDAERIIAKILKWDLPAAIVIQDNIVIKRK